MYLSLYIESVLSQYGFIVNRTLCSMRRSLTVNAPLLVHIET